MNLEDPTHPFLVDVAETIEPLGAFSVETTRIAGIETAQFLWTVSLANGFLFYGDGSDGWIQYEPLDYQNPPDVSLTVTSDCRVSITDFERSSQRPNVECVLRTTGELPELLDYFITAKAELIGSAALIRKSLSSMVEGSYVIVQRPDGDWFDLLPLQGQYTEEANPVMHKMLSGLLMDKWDDQSRLREELSAFVRTANEGGPLRGMVPLCKSDVIVDAYGRIRSTSSITDEEQGVWGLAPCVAFRLKKDVSVMWFSDYLEHASESEDLIVSLLQDWTSIPRSFKKIMIEIPSLKRDQIAHSIELRHARLRYRDAIDRLSSIREPFREITALYKKRAQSVDVLHGESLDDIQSIQRPLPFFLEYPYRHFRREDDHVQKIRAGQRLLGILAKVPLYLVVEELLAMGHDLGAAILDKLEERPPSDGTLVTLQKLVVAELGKLDTSPLVIFPRLQAFMENTMHLDAMVAARNRMHHEPYDEHGFLQTMSERAPQVVDALRGALYGCRFVVPQHCRVMDREKIVTVEDACCCDAHFRILDLKVELPLEQFPSGELMVWTTNPEQVLKLGMLLTSMLVTRQSRDFGVFDRIENQKRHFTFLRSE